MLFRCPHDLEPLEPTASGVRCPLGHTFDRAREGYLNLLLAGRRAPQRPPGDSAEMLRARRAFLDAGHYGPVGLEVARQAVAALGVESAEVLDAGCGEGWYLGQVLGAAPSGTWGWGLDVARDGVRMAARRYQGAGFAVASSYRMPVAAATVAVVVSVFAPRPWEEVARVLRPGGAFVVASPGADHLAGLRALVYAEPEPHDERPHAGGEQVGSFAVADRVRVRFELTLDGAGTAALLRMTPYWWQATAEQQAHVAALDSFATTVDIVVTTLRPG